MESSHTEAGRNGGSKRDVASGNLLTWQGYLLSTPVQDSIPIAEGDSLRMVALGKDHIAVLTENGTVMCKGDNSFGQLGRGNGTEQRSAEYCSVKGLEGRRVVHIACGAYHNACVTEDGLVYVWGSNAEGQLGLGKKLKGERFVAEPTQLNIPPPTGDNIALEDLSLLENCDPPCMAVWRVSCGASFTIATTIDGKCISWGSGLGLGLGEEILTSCEPTYITKLFLGFVQTVDCGPSHCVSIVFKDGEWNKCTGNFRNIKNEGHSSCNALYTWGRGLEGQLGHGDTNDCASPKEIVSLNGVLLGAVNGQKFRSVSAGGFHTLALSDFSKVYSWGSGTSGQLGHSEYTDCTLSPLLINCLQDKSVSSIATGDDFSVMLVYEPQRGSNDVLFFGPRVISSSTDSKDSPSGSRRSTRDIYQSLDSFSTKSAAFICAGYSQCAAIDDGENHNYYYSLRQFIFSEKAYLLKLTIAFEGCLKQIRMYMSEKDRLKGDGTSIFDVFDSILDKTGMKSLAEDANDISANICKDLSQNLVNENKTSFLSQISRVHNSTRGEQGAHMQRRKSDELLLLSNIQLQIYQKEGKLLSSASIEEHGSNLFLKLTDLIADIMTLSKSILARLEVMSEFCGHSIDMSDVLTPGSKNHSLFAIGADLDLFKTYQEFIRSFNDVKAVNLFAIWLKTNRELSACVQSYVGRTVPKYNLVKYPIIDNGEGSEGEEKNTPTSEDALYSFFNLPLSRLEEYKVLSYNFEQFSSCRDGSISPSGDSSTLKKFSSDDSLADFSENPDRGVSFLFTKLCLTNGTQKASALQMAAFWEAYPQLQKEFMIPERRILLHSKEVPLAMLKSSMSLSSHWFILFNDIFVQLQGLTTRFWSMVAQASLECVWVRDIESESVSKGCFKIITPEMSIVVNAGNVDQKQAWMNEMERAISERIRCCSLDTNSRYYMQQYKVRDIGIDCNFEERLSEEYREKLLNGERYVLYKFISHETYKDCVYSGCFMEGKMFGIGTMQFTDSSVYIGEWEHGMRQGFGKFVGSKYVGKNPATWVYEGGWKDDKMCGRGSFTDVNGDRYHGDWSNGERNGYGVLIESNGNKYVGGWQGSVKCGYGVYIDTESSKTKYLGNWVNNVRHGNGIICYQETGVYFEGLFENDKQHGQGVIVFKDNTVIEGIFSHGNLAGIGSITLNSGEKFEGQISGSIESLHENLENCFRDLRLNGMLKKTCGTIGGFVGSHISTNRESLSRASIHSQFERNSFSDDDFARVVSALETLIPHSVKEKRGGDDLKWKELYSVCKSELLFLQLQKSDEKTNEAIIAISNLVEKYKNKTDVVEETNVNEEDRQRKSVFGNKAYSRSKRRSIPQVEMSATLYNCLNPFMEMKDHPFGRLIENIVMSFQASYSSPREYSRFLLITAQNEINSHIARCIDLIFLFFPSLYDARYCNEDDVKEVLEELMFPRIYDILCALFCNPFDIGLICLDSQLSISGDMTNIFKKSLMKFDQKPDFAILTQLLVERKYWLMSEDEIVEEQTKLISSLMVAGEKEAVSESFELEIPSGKAFPEEFCKGVEFKSFAAKCGRMRRFAALRYAGVVFCLKQMCNVCTPVAKMKCLEKAFNLVNDALAARNGDERHMGSLDELLPVFLFVVIRACIPDLGAEIRYIEAFGTDEMKTGINSMMLITLKACYIQIVNEFVCDTI
eukprot:Nk52_evm35s207 gene=Nk52_evmTU35s207